MKKIFVDEHAQFTEIFVVEDESDRMLMEFKMKKMIFIKYRKKEEESCDLIWVFVSFHHLTAT